MSADRREEEKEKIKKISRFDERDWTSFGDGEKIKQYKW